MRRRRALAGVAVLLIVAAAGCRLTAPVICLTAGDTRYDLGAAAPGREFTLHYRHSVQLIPVWEYLAVAPGGEGFILYGTKYATYGVGLPFLPEEGTFSQRDGNFYLENMHRFYPDIRLRVGSGTELSIETDERRYELYRDYPPGTAVHLEILPLWRSLYEEFFGGERT